MLYSQDKCTKGEKRPHFSLWFGNFFEPYFSSKEMVRQGIAEIKEMGFNSIILDSKLWEDFTEFFDSETASPYVEMQQYMIEECQKAGLGINFLTLFYNGDNLYSHIRDSAPDITNPICDREGNPIRGYRMWDQKQIDAMVEHTVNLYKRLAKDAAAKAVDDSGEPKVPCYFYHSPTIMPSFDGNGRFVYMGWLISRYKSIAGLNRVYKTNYKDFDEIPLVDIWPEMTSEDYKNPGLRMVMHTDNMLFRQDMMERFFAQLTQGVREQLPDIYLYDCLSQWKYMLPDWVEISDRGLDIWRLGKYLDCPSFYTLPADAYGEQNAYVVPCEMAILRSASRNKDLVGGLFLGRYLFNDIYSSVTPAEVIASALGAGATELFFYGYSGLDDGGNFAKWSSEKKHSVKSGLNWFAKVREMTGKRLSKKQAAILFPHASFTLDNRNLNDAAFRACRNDSLGYYQQLSDLGINADFVNPEQVKEGALDGYKLLILPSNPLYQFLRDEEMEDCLRSFAENGGVVIAGGSCGLHEVFNIKASNHPEDSIYWEETITEFSTNFYAFDDMKANSKDDETPIRTVARYSKDDSVAMCEKGLGSGKVFAAGFDMGASYCARKHKPVPVAYGREDHYPLTVIKRTPIEKLLMDLGLSEKKDRGIERVDFEKGMLIINHTSYDHSFEKALEDGVSTFEGFNGRLLPGHHSVYVPTK
ncbi:MAG TPA: alpha-amylase family protein [Bacillota bacterium]|nr:alpha-amylase family protein [Bacillota bacterium]